jgi:hypothetical protein
MSDLEADCVLCSIIRQCFEYFIGSPDTGYRVSVQFSDEREDVQFCFEKTGVETCTQELHVQLYSTGLALHLMYGLLTDHSRATPSFSFFKAHITQSDIRSVR